MYQDPFLIHLLFMTWMLIPQTLCSSQLDVFTVWGPRVGRIEKIDIGYARQRTMVGSMSAMVGDAWQLASVQVVDVQSGLTYDAKFNEWISGKKKRTQLVPTVTEVGLTVALGARILIAASAVAVSSLLFRCFTFNLATSFTSVLAPLSRSTVPSLCRALLA